MTDPWTLALPYTLPPLLMNDRMHWRKKAQVTREVRATTAVLARALRVPACERIHVTLHYVPRDSRRRDPEGLVATQKPCIDGLVDAGIVPDDSPEYVTWAMPVIDAPDSQEPHLYLVIERVA